MEFRHLQTFQAIVQEGSFLRAAQKLQYAQSTITLHIQQLEAELGVKLFSRRGKRTELTVAGRTLQGCVEQLLHRAANLQQTIADLVAGEAGHLRIGSIEPVASVDLPAILVQFCQKYPKVRLTLEVGVTQAIAPRVATGELDLAICSPPHANLNLTFELLFQDPISLLIPKTHQLATLDEIPASLLASERLILTEEHCPYRNVIEKALILQGINPFSGIEVMSLEALKQMVGCGLGIGVMPTGAITSPPKNTIARNISDLDMKLPVGIVVQPGASFPGAVLDSLISDLKMGLKKLTK
ncbi:LysR family transcriptional regulator [Lusitaniella coriacea LEGE 07157]|uniref:LysR family transcriptional regulator n=1 Tax=Lusitaniella coriacea LEGE 07157 TaxID=945747 RepID=A0A8J7B2E6_9CYAN|nr:LysR family transcriptional regulator [Lusitaniella coriacea]MBE9114302.1 LysR family transcriptional regulator [Lusitaniella coriacea LEGE 07157]